jgi:glycine hydroxymethyltransferase
MAAHWSPPTPSRRLPIDRAEKLFKCRFANVQPHSGSNANAGVFLGLLKLGDAILSMNVAAGGHISHGHKATLTGRDYKIVSYGVSRESERIDLDEVRDLARREKPRMIIAGGSAYARAIDFASMRAIADEVAPSSWSTWRTMRAWSPQASIPARCRMPMS